MPKIYFAWLLQYNYCGTLISIMGLFLTYIYQIASARNFLLIAQRLIPVDFVVEAGTCNGEDTLDLFRTLRPKKYFAFEPDPVAYKTTKKLYVKNKIMKQIKLYPLALSDTEKYVYLHTATEFGLGHSNLTESKIDSKRVQCIRLESVLKTEIGARGGVLWLDAEGHSLPIIKGLGKLITEFKLMKIEVQMHNYKKHMPQDAFILHKLLKDTHVLVRAPLHPGFFGDVVYIRKDCARLVDWFIGIHVTMLFNFVHIILYPLLKKPNLV